MSRRVDFDAARRDVRAFADMIGQPLTEPQAEALRLDKRITVVVAPRQSGKSRTLATLALWRAFRQGEVRVLIVSSGEDAARRLLAEVRRIATGTPLLRGSVTDETTSLVTLSNGSEIRSVPASERQVRGWTVDLLLVDEAAMVPDGLLLSAAFPTTAARPDARIVLASSAGSASGAFFDHAVRGEAGSDHVKTVRWSLADAPWISPSMVEAARESMSPLAFAAEYEGRFAGSADAVFTRAQLDRATADYRLRTLEDLPAGAGFWAGMDWGAVRDRSSCMVIGRLPEAGERRFGVAVAQVWPVATGFHDVVDDVTASSGTFGQIVSEVNGMGEPASQMLFRTFGQRPDQARGSRWGTELVRMATSAQSKQVLYGALRSLIEREVLLLPVAAVELRRELELLRVDLSPGGLERIEAKVGGHDDAADALTLALGPYRVPGGPWRCWLSHFAYPDVELTGPAVERVSADRDDVVLSGGGVAVPRDPVWQSVDGPGVVFPVGRDPSRPVPPAWLSETRARVVRALEREGMS